MSPAIDTMYPSVGTSATYRAPFISMPNVRHPTRRAVGGTSAGSGGAGATAVRRASAARPIRMIDRTASIAA